MNHNKFNTHTEEKQPNYKLRRTIAGIALISTAVGGGGALAHNKLTDDTEPQLQPKQFSESDPHIDTHTILEHEPITINDGENVVDVSVSAASDLRNLPESEVRQPVTAQILEEQAADEIPRITHAGDRVLVKFDTDDNTYDVDVIVHTPEE